jgi:hypothetical protein
VVRAAAAVITANTDYLSNLGSDREPARACPASWLAAAIEISAACVSGAVAIAGPVFLETKPAFANCQVSKR